MTMEKNSSSSENVDYEKDVAVAKVEDRNADSANEQEKAITLRHVFKHHHTLVWWVFYWAMAAVGW
jgi:hypothetical protein